jgi:hypothetical protein
MPVFLAPVLAWYAAKKTTVLAIGWIKLAFYGAIVSAVLFSYGYVYMTGKDHGKSDIEISVKNRENAELKRAKDEVERLTQVTRGLQDEYNKTNQLAAAANTRAAAADARLRERTAQLKPAIDRASTYSLRQYAIGASSLYQACRDEYRDLGREVVGAANAAHTLKSSNDHLSRQITDPVPPLPPLPPQ